MLTIDDGGAVTQLHSPHWAPQSARAEADELIAMLRKPLSLGDAENKLRDLYGRLSVVLIYLLEQGK